MCIIFTLVSVEATGGGYSQRRNILGLNTIYSRPAAFMGFVDWAELRSSVVRIKVQSIVLEN